MIDLYLASDKVLLKEIGQKVKRLRIAANLSQKALAERMNCTQQYVSKILKGTENMSLDTLTKLEDALGIRLILDDSAVSYSGANDDVAISVVAEDESQYNRS